MSDDTQRPDERVETIRELFSTDAFQALDNPRRLVLEILDAYDEQRARAQRAEQDRDDIAESYATVLFHITNGALSMPSTDPQVAIAMSDDLDTERWNEETAALEERASRLEDIIEFIRTYDPQVVDAAEERYPHETP